MERCEASQWNLPEKRGRDLAVEEDVSLIDRRQMRPPNSAICREGRSIAGSLQRSVGSAVHLAGDSASNPRQDTVAAAARADWLKRALTLRR